MQIYLIASEVDRAELGTAILGKFGANARRVSNSQWLVAVNATPKDVLDSLGASTGKYGRVLIVGVVTYFGWHDQDIWDWIALKQRTP